MYKKNNLKVFLMCIGICSATQSECVNLYGGVGLNYGLTNSKFDMNYEACAGYARSNNGINYANHKKSNLSNLGCELFLGVNLFNKDKLFSAIEIDYLFNNTKHKHTFDGHSQVEYKNINQYKNMSELTVKHKDELGLYLKLGRNFDLCRIYGILGLSTKKIDVNYCVLKQKWINRADLDFSKRVYGAVFGIGVAKDINKTVSVAMEYKYKKYGTANKDIDFKKSVNEAFADNHDKSDRSFKLKSSKNELALKVAVNL